MYCWIYGMLLQGIYQGGVFVALIINVIPLSCTHNFSKWKVHEQFYEPLGTDLVQLLSSFLFCLRQQWVREEDLARNLMIPFNRLRQITHFLEQQKLVRRYYRKEVSPFFRPM